MLVVRAAKDWFLLIGQHWRATLPCFLGCALLYVGVSAWWPKSYTGTALIELNPSLNWEPDVAGQRSIENEAILEATTPSAWVALVERLHLSTETVADGRVADAAGFLASHVSIQQVEDAKHGGQVLRVSYTAPDKARALAVTQAVADNLANTALDGASRAASPSPIAASTPASLPASPAVQAAPASPNPPRSAEPLAIPSASARPRPIGRKRRPPQPSHTPGAVLARQLQSRVDEGAKLEIAINEIAATVSGLRQQLALIEQKEAAAPPIAKTPLPQPERKPAKVNPQLENLREELARSQQTLADLQKRYTQDYPDVVAAADKVRDLQTDIGRLEAIEARSAQVEAPRPVTPATAPAIRDESARTKIAERLSQAQSTQDQLLQAVDRNHAQQARLQSEIASSRAIEALPSSSPLDTAALPPTQPAALAAAPSAAAGVPAEQPGAGSSNTSVESPAGSDTARRSASAAVVGNTSSASEAYSPHTDSTTSSGNRVLTAPMSIAESPSVAVSPVYFAAPLSWLLSLVFGSFAAFAAAWLAERRDPSVRSEQMLRQVLPNSAAILGGIPRVRHEVIPE